jgi:hypothetical protein
VHKSFLSPLPKYARLPLLGLLMAMLALCQIPKLSAGWGIDYRLAGIFQGVPASLGQGPHLARKDFLGHLRDGLILLHALSSYRLAISVKGLLFLGQRILLQRNRFRDM